LQKATKPTANSSNTANNMQKIIVQVANIATEPAIPLPAGLAVNQHLTI
jgi:hypothetical protein